MKQTGQKSVKEELPEQRKEPKRAIEFQLKVPTYFWDRIPRHSNPTRRTKHCQTGLKSIEKQQKAAVFLYPFSPFRVIPNAEISRRRPLHRNIFYDKLFAFRMTRKCQELTRNVWIFESKHIRIFSAKRKKIHAAIPHNTFINDGIPLI